MKHSFYVLPAFVPETFYLPVLIPVLFPLHEQVIVFPVQFTYFIGALFHHFCHFGLNFVLFALALFKLFVQNFGGLVGFEDGPFQIGLGLVCSGQF